MPTATERRRTTLLTAGPVPTGDGGHPNPPRDRTEDGVREVSRVTLSGHYRRPVEVSSLFAPAGAGGDPRGRTHV